MPLSREKKNLQLASGFDPEKNLLSDVNPRDQGRRVVTEGHFGLQVIQPFCSEIDR